MFGGLTKMKYLCTRLQEQGFVAQLNRASDYGSEGSGFESQRSHTVARSLKQVTWRF